MARCKCPDKAHPLGMALWHRAWCTWYDHDRAGNRRRASAWGFLADRIVRWA